MADETIVRMALDAQAAGTTLKRDDVADVVRRADAPDGRLGRDRVDAALSGADAILGRVFGARLAAVEAVPRAVADTSEGRRRALAAKERLAAQKGDRPTAFVLQRLSGGALGGECPPEAAVLMAAAAIVYLTPGGTEGVPGAALLESLDALGAPPDAPECLLTLRETRALLCDAGGPRQAREDVRTYVSRGTWALGPRGRVEAPREAVFEFVMAILSSSSGDVLPDVRDRLSRTLLGSNGPA